MRLVKFSTCYRARFEVLFATRILVCFWLALVASGSGVLDGSGITIIGAKKGWVEAGKQNWHVLRIAADLWMLPFPLQLYLHYPHHAAVIFCVSKRFQ